MRSGAGSPSTAATAPLVLGPSFTVVDSVSFEDAEAGGGVARLLGPTEEPLVVTGLALQWPCYDRWSFERLARLRSSDGAAASASFVTGVPALGATEPRRSLPVAPYLRDLAEASLRLQESPRLASRGLLSADRFAALRGTRAEFRLNWNAAAELNGRTLAGLPDWRLTSDWPALRRDASAARALWARAGRRGALLESVSLGGSGCQTGLGALPASDLLSAQLRGTREWLLFPPDCAQLLRPSGKYAPRALCSAIDLTAMASLPPAHLRALEQAQGRFTRLAAGDVLFIPAGWWHAAVNAEPCLSLTSRRELPLGPCGWLARAAAEAAHDCGLYAFGWCTCHEHLRLRRKRPSAAAAQPKTPRSPPAANA